MEKALPVAALNGHHDTVVEPRLAAIEEQRIQTLKDSPQPQVLVALGFEKTKPFP